MGCNLQTMDATEKLLELELAREARRRTRNKWLIALLVVAVLFGAFTIWGVTSMNADRARMDRIGTISDIYRNS